MVPSDTENQSDRHHAANKGASSIADKRKRYTCDRQKANRHADILKYMEDKQADDASTKIAVKRFSCFN